MALTKKLIKAILDKIVLVAVLLLFKYSLTFALGFIFTKSGVNAEVVTIILILLNAFFYLFILLGLSYKTAWSKTTLENTKWRFVFLFVNIVLLLIIFGALAFKSESDRLYTFIKNPTYSSQGLFKTDSLLGYVPKPGNTGYHRVNTGTISVEKVVHTNSEGHRISLKKYPVNGDTVLLFLGCSFTWGDYSVAEETYPYLASATLGKDYINAGVSGYGLAQMFLLAKKIIPEKRPAYVVVQYSPWLVDRAISGYTPTHFGTRFSPFFTKINGDNTVLPPQYLCHLDEVPFAYYRQSKAGLADKMRFMRDVSLQVILIPYFKKAFFSLNQKLGLTPAPNTNKNEVEAYFYTEVYKTCKQYGSKMVVISLDEGFRDTYTRERFAKILPEKIVRDILFVEAQKALCAKVNGQTDYQERFYQQQNGVIYDDHPNYQAAQIIAGELINTLKTK